MAGSSDRKRKASAGAPERRTAWLNWILVIVAVALVGTVALAFGRHRAVRRQAEAEVPAQRPGVPSAVMDDFANISAATWDRAGTKDAAAPIFVGSSVSAGGKPVVLYIGAGYCPYCAAMRWSVIASLSRFGTFSGLTLAKSSSVDVFPSTPTFSFYGSQYTSQYIELQAVELNSSVLGLDGRYKPLQTPTPQQDSLIRTYDVPPYVPPASRGAIPFVLVGGRYMWSGSPFSPKLLADKTQSAIAATLPTGSGPAAQAILTNGNQLTAAICSVDGNQPADVCSEPVIRKAIEALPHKGP